MINMLVKTWSLTMNNARNIRIIRKQAENSLQSRSGMSWMTFMDDCYG